MSLQGKATPEVSAVVEASVGVSLLVIAGELQLRGHILQTTFPSSAEITFDKFPLNVGVRMDMVMVPLRLELRGVVLSFTLKIIDILIWHYETSTVTNNIFNTGLPEPDLTPPKFRKFKLKSQKAYPGRRSEVTTHCDVEQLPGRDVVEPAFQLAVAAEDDVSQVKLTYDVGTYRGGSDVVKGEDLGGPSNIIVRSMKGGVPLYFTVTAKNSGGGDAKVTCELPTYDVTLPGGRVTPDFLTTSHPNILRASAVAHDDSEIIQKLAAVGYGRKVYGDQIVTWHDVITTTHTAITGGDATTALERFTGPRLGKVISTPVETSRVDIPEQCASECLKRPPSKCLSFNYDYGDGDCELLEEIEDHGVEIHEVGHFYNFERLGVGHAVEFRHEDLKLRHNELIYFNLFLNNTLGYVNILTSPGVLTDFTPPSPGPLENVIMDVLMTEDCGDFVLDHWEQFRCGEQTPLPNHRWIADGKGSRTVFNGHEPLVDMRYTRANRYVSANWDGFHDDETGIHGYSWTVGTTPCEDDVHPHIDPHAHLFDVSEWTHEGIASPLLLEDGKYHVTVRAINNVEYGGAMATTVCHTTPYIIDNTPPFVHHVHSVQYDDDAHVISAEYNVSDPHSDIREIDFGLGRSKRDVHMMDWYRHGNTTHTSVNFHIPDGVPAWVKVRAINNVDLREVGHAEYPLLVDTSPPVAGTLYDGSVHGHDLNFTSDPNTMCANWKDFHDEESGLSDYLWGVGSEPGTDDVVPLTEYPHTTSQTCADVQLIHNTTYYSILVAVNNGHKHLNVTAWSDGVLFDATPPVEGTLWDGLDPDSDLQFSSEPSTVSANWDGYSDPESGIRDYAMTVQRTPSTEVTSALDHS
ncbi:Hypp9726 [Branchiostoma lanceolatum]|uniref:Hypp9726 protein n=1 Tax=Branchiostoma lanceolatum TaxID=7740 RepID=A0A8S4MQA5_BRALA|nr:Hypp9726 [Branchiostoma lanceolatum]